MKKMLSILLAAVMLVSAVPTAFAADTQDYSQGTQVVFEAANNESYTITVPAKLNPGQSGTVTLDGMWPSNKTVSVTAEPTVTLTNSILASDQKVLDVTFLGISKAGNDTAAQTFTETVSVEGIENALFGTWSGKFNYNVDVSNSEQVVAVPGATFYTELKDSNCHEYESKHTKDCYTGTVTLTWEELKLESNGITYAYNASAISDTQVGEGAFDNCIKLASIIIPDSVTSIETRAFRYCYGLTSITFSKNSQLTSIAAWAFNNCSKLTSIAIPDTVTSIGEYAFSSCMALSSITFGENSQLTKLEPSSIGPCGITSFVIPDGVTIIDKTALSSNKTLTSVVIPESVTNIGQQAFFNCESLITIKFTGTMNQWNAIPKNGTDTLAWNYNVPATEVICSDGNVPIS